jgi:hypothetical protein
MTETWHIIRDEKTERYELVGEWTEDGQTYGFRHSGLPERIAYRLCARLNAAAKREAWGKE